MEKTAKAGNSKYYFRTVKLFSSKNAPTLWDITLLYPEESDEDIGEIVAEFFNRISRVYKPLDNPVKQITTDGYELFLQPHEVSA